MPAGALAGPIAVTNTAAPVGTVFSAEQLYALAATLRDLLRSSPAATANTMWRRARLR